MTELEKYQEVNKCETLKELSNVIRGFADINGEVMGRTRPFSAEKMAINCEHYSLGTHNWLTREFGIRQQAMYILSYENKNDSK